MATIDCPRATGGLKGKVDSWYAVGVVWGSGADESDRDEVAVDIVDDNSPILHQSSVDVKIPRNGAYTVFLQPKFVRRYTGLIALHEVLHSGSWMGGVAVKFFKGVKAAEYGYDDVSRGIREHVGACVHSSPGNRSRIVLL